MPTNVKFSAFLDAAPSVKSVPVRVPLWRCLHLLIPHLTMSPRSKRTKVQTVEIF